MEVNSGHLTSLDLMFPETMSVDRLRCYLSERLFVTDLTCMSRDDLLVTWRRIVCPQAPRHTIASVPFYSSRSSQRPTSSVTSTHAAISGAAFSAEVPAPVSQASHMRAPSRLKPPPCQQKSPTTGVHVISLTCATATKRASLSECSDSPAEGAGSCARVGAEGDGGGRGVVRRLSGHRQAFTPLDHVVINKKRRMSNTTTHDIRVVEAISNEDSETKAAASTCSIDGTAVGDVVCSLDIDGGRGVGFSRRRLKIRRSSAPSSELAGKVGV